MKKLFKPYKLTLRSLEKRIRRLEEERSHREYSLPAKSEVRTNPEISGNRRNFLLTFFDKDEYTEKFVNGFFLVKSLNKDLDIWQVGVYTQESFEKYKAYQKFQLKDKKKG